MSHRRHWGKYGIQISQVHQKASHNLTIDIAVRVVGVNECQDDLRACVGVEMRETSEQL